MQCLQSFYFYKESKSKKKEFFLVGGGGCGKGGGGGAEEIDGWTDKPIYPFNFFKVGGITKDKCSSYGPDKLKL